MSGFTKACPECMHEPHFAGCKTGTIDRLMSERNRLVDTTELGAVSERLEEDNAADAKTVRSAMHELGRLRALQAWCLAEADRQLADDPTDETALEMRSLAAP